jgi:hypothetical protein
MGGLPLFTELSRRRMFSETPTAPILCHTHQVLDRAAAQQG